MPNAKPALGGPKFEIPNFDGSQFDMSKIVFPEAFRGIAEKTLTQTWENWEKMKAAAEDSVDVLENTCNTASRGAADCGAKMFEAVRANANANFDCFTALLKVASMSEVIEISTAHARKQFETLGTQAKELTAAVQKIATETAEPVRASVAGAMKKAG
jgi:phasin